ncbi:hypothetical protein Tco_1072122 [Tanacetum coccineum]
MNCIKEIAKDANVIEIDDQLLVLIKRQVETELMLEEKFRDLCEEVSNFVKEIEDVVKEVERLCCKDVAKETARLFMMDDPNITMEEYIKLQAEKGQGRGWTFNWETATYDKSYCDDLDFFIDFKADYPAIVYNDALTSNENVPSKPPVSIYNAIEADIDFSISFSNSDDEDYTFICDKDSFSYKLIIVNDLKPEPINDHVEINIE